MRPALCDCEVVAFQRGRGFLADLLVRSADAEAILAKPTSVARHPRSGAIPGVPNPLGPVCPVAFETANRHRIRYLLLRPQPVPQNRVAADLVP